MKWLDSEYSHSLFKAIGLTKDDFRGLRGIAESETTDRVVVWCASLSDQPRQVTEAENLARHVHTSDGYDEFFFDRVA